MELVIVSLGILALLIVVAGLTDLKARRRRKRLSIDQNRVRSTRHDTLGRFDLYDGPG